MTRAELDAAAYRYLGKAVSSPDATTQARMRAQVGVAIRDVLAEIPSLRRATSTLASVADQDAYGLPLTFTKIEQIVDQTNEIVLRERPLAWVRDAAPDPSTSTGTPYVWSPYGYQAVQVQPSNASELFLKSTGADTMTAYVEGFLTGGLARSASVALTSTVAVSLSASLTTWERVTKFYVASAPVGVVSLHEDSGAGTTLAQIPIGKTSSKYQAIRLWPTPSEALTYHIDGEAAWTDLAQDADSPPGPEDFHEVYVFGACWRECLRMEDGRAASFQTLYREKLKQLKGYVNTSASTRLIPGGLAVGHSSLGSMYPVEDWL